jgi:nitroreductase
MDVLEAIKTRRSVRAYSSREITSESLERCRQALRFAPSACNYQPWRFIFVTDAGLRKELARASYEQTWIAEAPVVVVACALPHQAFTQMGGHGNSAEIDVAIALDHLTLVAVAEGLGTCWIGAFSEPTVKRLLDVPEEAKVVALTPLGYPKSADLNRPLHDSDRKRADEVFSTDRYGRR